MCIKCKNITRSRQCAICGRISSPAPPYDHMRTWACVICAPESPWNIEHHPELGSKPAAVGILKREVAESVLDISDLQTRKYRHSNHFPQYPFNTEEEEHMWFGV